MCGIFGIASIKYTSISLNIQKKILKNLFLLSESRGKEASGIAIKQDNLLHIYKTPLTARKTIKTEQFKNIEKKITEKEPYTAIGHARMVTNGYEKFSENNQPIIRDNIVGIHNGIIVNDAELWKKINQKPKTQLDSEIIPALINHYQNQNISFHDALNLMFNDIKGMASIALLPLYSNVLSLASNNGSLYYVYNNTNDCIIFASEYYMLSTIAKTYPLFFNKNKIKQAIPDLHILIDTNSLKHYEYSLLKHENNELVQNKTRNHKIDIIDYSQSSENNTISLNSIFSIQNNEISKDLEKFFESKHNTIKQIKRCTKCLLPETFPFIEFDKQHGICNYCHNHKKLKTKSKEELIAATNIYKRKDNRPDSIVTFSGGRDSSYCLHYVVKELGMKPIAYSYDWGMITDLARRNQSRMCGKLGIEHILISADIRKKRRNIKKNILAWLNKPSLGTIPLFMAGDKQYFYWANQLVKQNNLDLVFFGENKLENTNFKSGFCGVKPLFDKSNIHTLSLKGQSIMSIFYLKEFLLNPKYINISLLDTIGAFFSYYQIPHDYLNIFDYIKWNENEIDDVLLNQYEWETSPDTTTTWRIGDGTAAFYNYIYYIIAGFTENDTFRSNQIREGLLTRKDALKSIEAENQPRWNSIKWYCDTIGIDFESTIKRINKINNLY